MVFTYYEINYQIPSTKLLNTHTDKYNRNNFVENVKRDTLLINKTFPV